VGGERHRYHGNRSDPPPLFSPPARGGEKKFLRIGRTSPGPPPEVEGSGITEAKRSVGQDDRRQW
jgi:hypothetical protein